MNDTGKVKAPELADSAARLGDSPFGMFAGLALLVAVPIGLLAVSDKWDGHLHPQQGCVQLQKIDTKLFKVNTCTGDVEEYKPDEPTPSTGTAKQ